MNDKIVFSIIIPHKNTPDLLHRCLNSIPRRDDIQIIVVDDNSDENIVDFDNFPGLREKSVEIYLTKGSKGAGYARNVGLEHAKGKWLLFADADDFFTENAFEYIFAEVHSPHEIICFKVTSCYSDTYKHAYRGDGEATNKLIYDYNQKIKDSENNIRYKHHVPWGKMIKRSLVQRKNIKFEEVIASNDIFFSLLIGYYACSITVVNNIIYCVTVTKGSLTNRLNIEILTARFFVCLRYNKFLQQIDKKQYQMPIVRYVFYARKYGIRVIVKFIKLAIQNKSNPFTGLFRLIISYPFAYKYRMNKKKYTINS
jgi:glycosyltransferase involved in cell wall biosynthesis